MVLLSDQNATCPAAPVPSTVPVAVECNVSFDILRLLPIFRRDKSPSASVPTNPVAGSVVRSEMRTSPVTSSVRAGVDVLPTPVLPARLFVVLVPL